MKIALSNDDLKAAVTTVAVAASGKSPLPILNHLLLQADCGRLRVSATDLEIAMTRDVTATVTDTGGCAVPARLLSDLVSQLEDGEVKLELDGYRLTVQNRSSRYRLNVLSADEFPILADTPDQIDVRIDVSTLHTMLSHVKTCVAPPCETRESIKGVLVELEGATLSATTTDGRRLAHIEHKQAGEARGSRGVRVVVAAAAMTALERLLSNAKSALSVAIADDRIWFSVDGTVLMARSPDCGKYPDHRQITPKSSARTAHMHRAPLVAALRRAMISARGDKDSPSLLKLDFQPDQLRISSNSPAVGDGEEIVPVRLDGGPVTIAFNGRYLIDAVAAAGSEELIILMNDPLSMSVVKPVGNDDLFYLVMPVRIKEVA